MKCTLTLLLCLPFCILAAQSPDHFIISPQGGFSKGETMSMSWTIGDFVTESTVLTEAIVTQGFQQPTLSVRELDSNQDLNANNLTPVQKGITMRNSADFNASVFPNPFGSDITVQIENSKQEYYLDIFDPTGNLLSRNKSSDPQQVINMKHLPPADYILRISLLESKESKAFQITKSR